MAVKTITVTENAYGALKALKEKNESFSETILRISGKKSLKKFVGALSPESADRLERTIKELRRHHTIAHRHRIQRIVKELQG